LALVAREHITGATCLPIHYFWPPSTALSA
jgi:hypothetical protein